MQGIDKLRFAAPVDVDRGSLVWAATTWWTQFSAMCYKFWAVLWHRKALSLVLILLPAALIGLLAIVNNAVVDARGVAYPSTPVVIPALSPCASFDVYGRVAETVDCITLAYAPSAAAGGGHGGTASDQIMSAVAAGSGLATSDIRGFASASDIARYGCRCECAWSSSGM